ncbi:hypothetical protein [Altererythrobacter sp.]|uniref:hypothetical protein n=1 Tax=Altererythrobacter sp. TaxID=1872480 RepID=UPI003D0935B3
MRNLSRTLSTVILVAICFGCASPPTNICQMPQNRHFWQGLNVSWRGEIIDVMAVPHGGGVYFTDYRCGRIIEIDPKVVPKLFSGEKSWSHLAVADFYVQGHLAYDDGEIVLRPDLMRRTSEWGTLENGGFERYRMKRKFKPVGKWLGPPIR